MCTEIGNYEQKREKSENGMSEGLEITGRNNSVQNSFDAVNS